MRSHILFISAHRQDARRLLRMLHALPVVLHYADTVQHARLRLQQEEFTVVLTEAVLRDGGWLDVLQLVRDTQHAAEVIVTDPHADARFWAESLNMGAYDLLAQPFYEPEVRRILFNACSRAVRRTGAMAGVAYPSAIPGSAGL